MTAGGARARAAVGAGLVLALACHAATDADAKPVTVTDLLADSPAQDWRTPDPDDLLYLQLPSGRVVIELASRVAPQHVANIKKLARAHYFDGLAIVRVQDNYVVQWNDPEHRRPVPAGVGKAVEFTAEANANARFEPLADRDAYAPEVGFLDGFPAARDPRSHTVWLAHCYGMVGAGRDNDVDSGGGTELYVVIGQAPRHLDRNVTLLGRVVSGMELLSVLPRGSGRLGRYERAEQYVPVSSVRVAADVPPQQRTNLAVLRTDTPTFLAYLEARRNRREDWFKVPAGRVDVCNVPVPVRPVSGSAAK